ncbi:MAG: phytanoyl-CoA dioxygenase family protein [Pseudomonadota bacterium]
MALDHHAPPTNQQVKAYWENGFLFPCPIFDAAEVSALRAELEALEATWLDNGLPRPLNQYKRVNAHVVMPLACDIATDGRVLDVVERVLGPDIMIWSVEFFIKEPGTKSIVSMHQDLTYWGMGDTSDLVTAWIALSPVTKQSGCMGFWPGSHKNPILPHKDTFDADNLLSRGQEIAVDVPEADKVFAEIAPGQMSLHHGLMVHGSGPNVSDDRRIAVAIRYLNPNARQKISAKDYAMLARGVDHMQNFTPIGRPRGLFHPTDLALYDQILKDQTAALAQGAAGSVEMYEGAG